MGLFDDLNRAGLLAIGLIPEWVDHGAYSGAPASVSAGVDLQSTPKALLHVALRENVSYRTSRVVVTVGDVASTYTTAINGNNVATTPASAVLSDVATEIKDDINADGVVNLLVTASIDPADTTGATVLLVGIAETDYYIDSTVAAGTGAVTFSADALTTNLRLYLSPGGIIKSGSTGYAPGWFQPADGNIGAIGYRGWGDRIDCAGYDRAYIELDTIAGHSSDGSGITFTVARVMIGPAVLEATS